MLGAMPAWLGHVTVEAALLTAPVGAVLGDLAGYAVGRRWKGRVPAPLQAGAGGRRYTERVLGHTNAGAPGRCSSAASPPSGAP
ncbi:hypothetical protein [Streptomyces canus]|uniref:hypothetical protein n=1 Tax=Streptomyces canus TaxID=58343 RepID=UPI000746FD34|nr:hypothetical protein [Streptomyces canus]KUN13097.1 hypothetical protein AQI96_11575 [Streptomyces canus]